jgi:hypothetical protein
VTRGAPGSRSLSLSFCKISILWWTGGSCLLPGGGKHLTASVTRAGRLGNRLRAVMAGK